jgi:hypothetical protein
VIEPLTTIKIACACHIVASNDITCRFQEPRRAWFWGRGTGPRRKKFPFSTVKIWGTPCFMELNAGSVYGTACTSVHSKSLLYGLWQLAIGLCQVSGRRKYQEKRYTAEINVANCNDIEVNLECTSVSSIFWKLHASFLPSKISARGRIYVKRLRVQFAKSLK